MKKNYIATTLMTLLFAFSANATMVFNDFVEEGDSSDLARVANNFKNGFACKPVFGEFSPENVDDSVLTRLVQEAVTHEETRKPIRRMESLVRQFSEEEEKALKPLREEAETLESMIKLRQSFLMSSSLIANMELLDQVSKPAQSKPSRSKVSEMRLKFEKGSSPVKQSKPFELKDSPFQQSFAFFKGLPGNRQNSYRR